MNGFARGALSIAASLVGFRMTWVGCGMVWVGSGWTLSVAK